MTSIEKLFSISGQPVSPRPAVINFAGQGDLDPLVEQLEALLNVRNGFYAFESALHVFSSAPNQSEDKEMTLSEWNAFNLWRFEYGALAHRSLFFAEDAFGNQFCLHAGHVRSFDAETGEMSVLSNDLEGWATRLLAEYDVLTGYPVIHKWQEKNGPLPVGARLMPKIPFVQGGAYSLNNLYSLKAVSAMKSRGNLARQLKDLPDGTQVEFRVIE